MILNLTLDCYDIHTTRFCSRILESTLASIDSSRACLGTADESQKDTRILFVSGMTDISLLNDKFGRYWMGWGNCGSRSRWSS